MSDVVIDVQELSKKFRVIKQGVQANNVRDFLLHPFKNIKDIASLTQVSDSKSNSDDYFYALKDINFQVSRGEVIGVIGLNGSGKTTLLKILSKITAPSEGRVRIKGRLNCLLAAETGFNHELTGRENVYMNGTLHGMSRKKINEKFDEIVEFSGVKEFIDIPVKRYSTGMAVRLGFAVAAYLDPEVLVVDEVLAVGDAEFQQKCIGKMNDVSGEGRTILFVSHNMNLINSLCHRCVYLKKGEVQMIGHTSEVVEKYITDGAHISSEISWDSGPQPTKDGISFIKSSRVINEEQENITSVPNSKKIGIEVNYHLKDVLFKPVMTIDVYSIKGEHVFRGIQNLTDDLFKVGNHSCTMWISPFLLNQDSYLIDVALVTLETWFVHFYEQKIISFSVYEEVKHRKHPYRKPIPGVILPELEWSSNHSVELS